MLGIPFIMFVHRYLQMNDKYVHKILLGYNFINIILVFLLQALGIADMKQTLTMTHVGMMLGLFYLLFSIVYMICKHNINRRFWVATASLCTMWPPLLYSLFLYYNGTRNVDSYGDVFIFLFILIFAIDVCITIMKEIDAGKKVAIYRELAEKDMLTDCYNRNAYRNDTENWKDLHGVLLVTCDLNNLKRCNDTLGHAYGDKYIMDAAGILKKIFSKYGKVYRIGGDEFCIIIPGGKKCNMNKLLAVMTEEQRIYNLSSKFIYMQIACGYTEFDAKTDSTMEDIRNRADELMYENKEELKKHDSAS
jgi:diguanylate cyclase (GGDEF)-like protein